ncbi:hypothetical protein ADEAN_000791100 [Angomonas deanei]|uniref:Uncharacterized protein n=1 Tax=Angomonas deanei TaxID=59799 RepID=A0A7G2CPB9_9TRYP|nr:hypothetical protein ADEAN_000791100 [Angomonas deanei]
MALIALDKRMSVFDEFSGKLRYARPKTSDLNCQLAQVQYVFTDKTGTLTENLMTYVGGRAGNVSHDERALPGGLGLALLAQIVNLRGGGKNQPLSPGSRHSGDAAAGSNYLSPGLSRRPAGSIPDLLLLSQTQGSATGEGEEGQSRQEAKVFTAAEESILEDNHIFKYLRSLSLCHSVVCFDAVEPVAAPKKEKKKNKKKKKDKKNGEKDETKQQKEKEKNENAPKSGTPANRPKSKKKRSEMPRSVASYWLS